MENINENFDNFLNFSSQLIQQCRLSHIKSGVTFPISPSPLKHTLNPLNMSNDSKNQLHVIELYLTEAKTNHQYLMEQWIFNLYTDKIPQRLVKIIRTQNELKIALNSLSKTLTTLAVNLPLYKEFLNKSSKYSSEISHDFRLSYKIIKKPSEISNFQGWDSQKWTQYYHKFPLEDELSFYVTSLSNAFKFSFQLNYFKNLYDLYKVLDPIKPINDKNRTRFISEQISSQKSLNLRNIIHNDNLPSNQFIQWTSKHSLSFQESFEETFLSSLTPRSVNITKNEGNLLSPITNEVLPSSYEINQSYSSLFRGVLLDLNNKAVKKVNREGLYDKRQNEGAFLNFKKANGLERKITKERNSNEEFLVEMIEKIEEKKKESSFIKDLDINGTNKIKHLLNELKKFKELLDN